MTINLKIVMQQSNLSPQENPPHRHLEKYDKFSRICTRFRPASFQTLEQTAPRPVIFSNVWKKVQAAGVAGGLRGCDPLSRIRGFEQEP
jgi:hypothetical protein